MATSKFKCGTCKQYFPQDQAVNRGISRYCSQECAYGRKRTVTKRAPRKKPSNKSVVPPAVRREVLHRDQGCRFCGTRTRLHIHHIVYRSQGGTHVPENLITLCNTHHDLVHSDKKRYMNLCQGVVWLSYLDKRVSIPQYERWLAQLD